MLALDRADFGKAKSNFIRSRKVEEGYGRRLRKIASHIGELVNAIYNPDDPFSAGQISNALDRYASILEPWARAVGLRMVAEVDARDKRAWREASAEMSRLMQVQLNDTPVGLLTRQRLDDQVALITSLPRDAAERVRKLTLEGLTQGTRAKEIAAEIMRSGDVSRSRATLIAVTEVSRTSTEFTRARAESAGSDSYIWRTSKDGDVRHDHRILEGKVFRWSEPPIADRRTGARAHPGCIYRCRCYPEPIFPNF
jgi:SPP1 gp7 family putative phage head morphogenesis protein